MKSNMQLVFCDISEDLVGAWQRFCGDLSCVVVQHGSILDSNVDAVVSPANSFGFMDGGIDAAYTSHFGGALQARVQKQIAEFHAGELVVGNADIVETASPVIPFLIIAPTMRVPMVLRDSVNPYLAMRAILLLVLQGRFQGGSHNGERVADYVQTVAIPGLGTGIGQIGANTCAHQMRAAIGDILLGQYKPPQSWVEASERHQMLYTTNIKRLQLG